MLSIAKMSIGQIDYYVKLQSEDYYFQGGEPIGKWIGTGAIQIGLSGQVKQEAIHNLLQGYNSDGTQALTQQQQYTQPHAGCQKTRSRQPGWDLTFSVPKSVSIAWALSSLDIRREIETAIFTATQHSISYLERYAAQTRRGHGGKYREKADLVVAAFPHSTSRALDPQFHIHCLVMNIAVRADGTTGTIDSKRLYDYKMTAGALFRSKLAFELRHRLGLLSEPDNDSFKLKGIPETLCHHFSKRRQTIRKQLDALGTHTAADAAYATIITRKSKGEVPPREQLFQVWQKEAAQFGVTSETIAALVSHKRSYAQKPCNNPNLKQLSHIIDSTAEEIAFSQNTFKAKDIISSVLNATIDSNVDTQFIINETENRLKKEKKYISIMPLHANQETIYTTRHCKQLQRDFLIRIRNISKTRHFVVAHTIVEQVISKYSNPRNPVVEEVKYHFSQIIKAARSQKTKPINRPLLTSISSQTLNNEGQDLVRTLTQKKGQLLIVDKLGNEQTYIAIRASISCWRKAGFEVIATSPYQNSTKRLGQAIGVEAMTHRKLQLKLHPTLAYRLKHCAVQLARAAMNRPTYTLKPLRLDKSKIVIIDRADKLGLEELNQLTRDIERHGGKTILLMSPRNSLHNKYNMTADLLATAIRYTTRDVEVNQNVQTIHVQRHNAMER